MGESLPECPIDAVDRDAMRDYLTRQAELVTRKSDLSARTFGQRVLHSGELRHTISRLQREQRAARSLHPDLFTPQNTTAYQQWVDTLTDY